VFAYAVVVPYACGNDTIGNRHLCLSQIYFFHFVYEFNCYFNYQRSSKLIILLLAPFWAYTTFATFFALLSNPYAVRMIKYAGEYTLAARLQGVGGYEFIYMSVFVSIGMLFVLINWKQLRLPGKYIVLSLAVCLPSLAAIALSNYFTALVMLFCSLSVFIVAKKTAIANKIIFMVLLLFVVVGLRPIGQELASSMIHFIGPGKTVGRLQQVQDAFGGRHEALTELTMGRRLTVEKSVRSMLRYPCFGLVVHETKTDLDGRLLGFGNHSQFIDTFSLYGIPFGCAFFYIILKPLVKRVPRRFDVYTSFHVALIVSVLILFFFDNATPSIGFAIYLLCPLLVDEIKKHNKHSMANISFKPAGCTSIRF